MRQGKFHIYAVKTIDEGIEVVTGVPAWQLKPDGTCPEGTINYLVSKKLNDFADRLKEYQSA